MPACNLLQAGDRAGGEIPVTAATGVRPEGTDQAVATKEYTHPYDEECSNETCHPHAAQAPEAA